MFNLHGINSLFQGAPPAYALADIYKHALSFLFFFTSVFWNTRATEPRNKSVKTGSSRAARLSGKSERRASAYKFCRQNKSLNGLSAVWLWIPERHWIVMIYCFYSSGLVCKTHPAISGNSLKTCNVTFSLAKA